MAKRSLRKRVPQFDSESAEREFWETHDTSPYVDWAEPRIAVFPNLKPSTETISLRLPIALLLELKALASKKDVPYQSLLKVYLADRVAREVAGMEALHPSRIRRKAKSKTPRRAARGSGPLNA